jgi:hypothetical protein
MLSIIIKQNLFKKSEMPAKKAAKVAKVVAKKV